MKPIFRRKLKKVWAGGNGYVKGYYIERLM